VSAPATSRSEALQPKRHFENPNKYKSQAIIFERRARRVEQAQHLRARQAELEEQARRKKAEEDARMARELNEANRYVRGVIAPWATQARLSELISDDFEDMKASVACQKPYLLSYPVAPNKTPVVGGDKFTYLPPERVPGGVGGDNRSIHRGFVEQETYKRRKQILSAAVRLYVTVFSEAVVKNGKSEYKDIQQNNGRVEIYSGKDPILWVNAGQPLRAIKWYEKYKAQSTDAKPLIRSFLIPASIYYEISSRAGLESEASKNPKRSFNVDRHYASDQFGIRGTDLNLLKSNIISGSLITYTENINHVTPGTAGQVKPISDLRRRLGVPRETIPGVWVNPGKNGLGGDFTDKKVFGGLADTFMGIYAVWTGLDVFLPEKMIKIPRCRRLEIMREELSKLNKVIPDVFWRRMVEGETPAQVAASVYASRHR